MNINMRIHIFELRNEELNVNKILAVINATYAVAYFLMKETLPSVKFMPLIKFIEKACEVTQLSHFNHTSPASHREMFLELGAAVKDRVLENVPNEGPIGLLTDEATDISVTSQLITFIQFFNKALGKTDTAFLGMQDVLEEHDAPDAKTITEKLEHLLQENGFSVDSVGAMATDGRGCGTIAAKENQQESHWVHWICHNLQLSCNDSNDEKYISNVLETLRQLWYFMENSPKRTKAYLKIQMQMKKISLVNEKGRKIVARKLKKACKTRWLSYEKSVSSLLSEFEAVLQFLHRFADSQATAAGLLKKLQNAKFVGTLYILGDILPILSEL